MNLDIRTLFVAISLVIWINAGVITLVWYHAKSMRSIIGYWSLSQILLGVGTLLITLRDMIPDLFSIILGSSCVVGGLIAMQEGIARYMSRAGYLRKAALGALFLQVISALVFTYIIPAVTVRYIIYSLIAGLISIISIATLKKPDFRRDMPRTLLVIILIFIAFLMFFQVAATVWQGGFTDFMNAGFLQAACLLGILCVYTSLSLCLFWIIAHNLGLEVQRQAFTDALTKIPNRRAMDNLLKTLISHKGKFNIGVIMIDIDKFKQINDQFGHRAGDRYLIELSRTISANLRQDDAVFRYAGDEFVVVACDVDYAKLTQAAECIRKKVEELAVSWKGQYLKTTVSIGVAVSNSQTKGWDELLQTADEALYRGKNQGGNRVESSANTLYMRP